MKVREMPQLVIRTKPSVKEWVERKAEKEERSQNWLIGKILEEAMQRDEQLLQA
jgi:hypothetical protein